MDNQSIAGMEREYCELSGEAIGTMDQAQIRKELIKKGAYTPNRIDRLLR